VLPVGYPSDSGEDSPDLGVTVDTISVRFPATEDLLAQLPYARQERLADDETGVIYEQTRGGEYGQQVGHEVVRLYASSRTGSPQARVTFSAPKMLNMHNTFGCDLKVIPDCVDAVLLNLSDELSDIPSWRDVEVVRLDLVRDFSGLSDVRSTLNAIADLPVARAKRHSREHALADGRLVYFRKGFTRSWKVRGYDKAHHLSEAAIKAHQDSRDIYNAWAAASTGRLRYEVELARDLLHRRGLSTVTALEDDRALVALAREYFELGNFGALTGTGRPLAKLLSELRGAKRQADARNLLVYLASQALGEPPPLNRHAFESSRALARRHQLSSEVFTNNGEPRRLDFETGRELLGEDAVTTLEQAHE
jgi:hypothetical protein